MMNMENNRVAMESKELDQVNGGEMFDWGGLFEVFGLPFGKKAIEEHEEEKALKRKLYKEEKKNNTMPNVCIFSNNF